MRLVKEFKILSFATAVFAVLMLAAPGYSYTGQQHRGHGGYNNHGYHNTNNGHRSYGHGSYNGHRGYGHGYYNGHRRYGHGSWNGYYRASRYPYYYGSRYYAPSVSLAFPFPFFLPGFSFYIAP